MISPDIHYWLTERQIMEIIFSPEHRNAADASSALAIAAREAEGFRADETPAGDATAVIIDVKFPESEAMEEMAAEE